MSFIELVLKRQSVRRFDPRPVEAEKIRLCHEAARLAPSASNAQPWHFIVVDDPELKNQVAEATFDLVVSFNRFVMHAPVIIVMVTEKYNLVSYIGSKIKKRDWRQFDTGIAAEHFCLQAAELGLGTCMLGWFDEKKIKALLNIPDERPVTLLIALGYRVEDYRLREKIRKTPDEIISYNSYPVK